MRRAVAMTGALLASALFAACPFDVIHVEQSSATIVPCDATTRAFVLKQDVPLSLPHGYRRLLKQGTKWTCMGTIAAGDVYATKDQVLTVEASNIHEAYIVVNTEKLVGFYLPVERTYSPASEPTSLPMREP